MKMSDQHIHQALGVQPGFDIPDPTQIMAQAVGSESCLHEESEDMANRVHAQGAPAFIPGAGDNLVWPGLLRKLERTNPGHAF